LRATSTLDSSNKAAQSSKEASCCPIENIDISRNVTNYTPIGIFYTWPKRSPCGVECTSIGFFFRALNVTTDDEICQMLMIRLVNSTGP
jgi:hypothetical protein